MNKEGYDESYDSLIRRVATTRAGSSQLLPSVNQWLQLPQRRLYTTKFKATDFKMMQATWQARDLFQERTHFCHSVGEKEIGTEIVLCGWIASVRRLSNKLIFLTLRDHSGSTQCVVGEKSGSSVLSLIENCIPETVVGIRGSVQKKHSTSNDKLELETLVKQLHILSIPQGQLAFTPSNTRDLPREEIRLQARYLDLRRSQLQRNLQVRSDCARITREALIQQNFQEIETPLLFKPTPEGAREFLVPTRHGSYYALPQSPQQYKQLLMASGVNRYFQIAKCFRDEDHRSDRQPEFTQIDMELSYATPAKVMEIAENLVKKLWCQIKQITFNAPFPVMPYQVAMSQYGSDKPDLRGGHVIKDVTSQILHHAPFLAESIPGFQLHALHLPSSPNTPSTGVTKKWIKENVPTLRLTRAANPSLSLPNDNSLSMEARLAWQAGLTHIAQQISPNSDDLIAFEITQGPFHDAWTGLGRLRLFWLSFLPLDPEFRFLWVTQFPLLAPVASHSQDISVQPDHPVDYTAYAPVHHPFTSPMPEDFPLLFTAPDQVRAEHYDLVLNGIEIGGGSIRIHDPDLQAFVFREVMQMTPEGINRFHHLLTALRSGCPPHGGIALGILICPPLCSPPSLGFDRLVALLCDTTNLRDVIAFPKASNGADLTVGSPTFL